VRRTAKAALFVAAMMAGACSTTPTSPTSSASAVEVGAAAQETPSLPTVIIPTPNQALGATRFLAFGDSITYGTISSFDSVFLSNVPGSYPSVLESWLDQAHAPQSFVVLNEGSPGETARNGVDRLPGVLDRHRPQVLLLLEGINDMNINNASPAQVASNVRNMVQIARLYNCTVLVATMPQTYPATYPDGSERSQSADKIVPFNSEVRRLLAGAQNVHIVDVYAAFGSDRSLMGNDGLHPTAAGYQRMAQEFLQVIRQVFPVRGSLQ
jgi:lysophospholipase L1-like esterase